jgi:uncharacterized protein YycO
LKKYPIILNYKKLIVILVLSTLLIAIGLITKRKYYDPTQKLKKAKEEVKYLTENNYIKEGDIIFQTSLSQQSKAIQLATHSLYSHCGIIFINKNQFYVFEAVQPVKFTPLENWIAKGKNCKYVLKRLKDSERIITREVVDSMKQIANRLNGKNYDLTFEWSDEKMYCSELIWKIYKKTTGLNIGTLQKLQDFDLSDEIVRDKMKERYGDNIPLEEIVISPASIFNSDLLLFVKSN